MGSWQVEGGYARLSWPCLLGLKIPRLSRQAESHTAE